MSDTKHCRRCDTTKDIADFYKDRSRGDGLANWCKICQNETRARYLERAPRDDYMREYARANYDKVAALQREARMRRQYGITPEEYATMLADQGGVCAICKSPGDENSYGRLYVDHNHETGMVRGLLCNTCNAGLGQFGDSIELLLEAIEYLKKELN